MLQNRIPRVCFYFCSMEQNSKLFSLPQNGLERNSKCLHQILFHGKNSELFSLPQNGSERNSKCLYLHLFHGTEIQVVFSSLEWLRTGFQELLLFLFQGTKLRPHFSSAEWFGMEFREISIPRNSGILMEQTNCSVYSIFRSLIFLSEIANPSNCLPHHNFLGMLENSS